MNFFNPANGFTASTVHVHFPLRPRNPSSIIFRSLFQHPPPTRSPSKTPPIINIAYDSCLSHLHVRNDRRSQQTILNTHPTRLRHSIRPIKPNNPLLNPEHPRPRNSEPSKRDLSSPQNSITLSIPNPKHTIMVACREHSNPPTPPLHIHRHPPPTPGTRTHLQNQPWVVDSLGPHSNPQHTHSPITRPFICIFLRSALLHDRGQSESSPLIRGSRVYS